MLLSFSSIAFDEKKLDSLFNIIESENMGMGTISIFHGNQEIYTKSIGFADLDNKVKSNKQTIYRIGSISKTFTAAIFMKLVEEGKVNLEDPLSKYFPLATNAHKITMDMLLKHQSGLYNFTNSGEYLHYYTEGKSRAELLKLITEEETVFNPGEKYEYSNTNYVLLSLIIEEIEGKPFDLVFKERISKPLALNRTFIGKEIQIGNNEAFSYERIAKWEKQAETNLSIPLGAGSVVSTPNEINQFLIALFHNKLISDSSLATMTDLKDGNFGYGIFKIPFYEKEGWGHSGGIDGFNSLAVYFPEDSISITYVSNGTRYSVNDILIGAMSIYFNKEGYELPDFQPSVVLSPADLEPLTGVYSSEQFPLKITIEQDEHILLCQATGQPQFSLEAIDKTTFQFIQAGLRLKFYPKEHKMVLFQAGAQFELFKK